MRCWFGYLSGVRCRLFAYCPADATAVPKPHHLLHHLNPDWFYLSGTGLSRLSWKRPLNGCSSRSSSFSSCYSLSCVIPRTLYLNVVIDAACIVCGMSTMKLLSILSVCLSHHFLLWAWQPEDIDRLLHGQHSSANANSVMSAGIGS